MSEYFENSKAHVTAELRRMKLKVRLAIDAVQSRKGPASSGFLHGFSISDEDVNIFVQRPDLTDSTDTASRSENHPDDLNDMEEEIRAKKTESLRRNIALRLEALERLFRLSRFEIDALLLCLLPEIDPECQKIYSYLQDDATSKLPTVHLALELLGGSLSEKLEARRSFSPESSLIKYGFVHLQDVRGRSGSLLGKSLHIDERIVSYLFDIPHEVSEPFPFIRLIKPELGLDDLFLPDDTRRFLDRLISRLDHAPICHLYGEKGSGKKAVAGAICRALGVSLLVVDVPEIQARDGSLDTQASLIYREGLLHGTALYLDACGTPENGAGRLMQELERYPYWIFIAGNEKRNSGGDWTKRASISLELKVPSYTDRVRIWEKYWDETVTPLGEVNLKDIAGKFRLTGGQIKNVAAKARHLGRLRDEGGPGLDTSDVASYCRSESREILNNLATKIQPKYGWQDIILPPDLLEQLREIYNYVQHYHKVYSDWGFEKKLSLGKGLNVLFSGQSGTGKTMAAEVLAHELQLDLYRIDLSAVVSKYIGETEKNLDKVFKEGQTSNAVLFFDEADALFGKRSEVKDAHDRYANIETAYLLQKMDEYEGVVVLATNLRSNIDDAFSRRMHYAVEFQVPDEKDRERIWKIMFPPEAPLSQDMDFACLAGQFKITGGNIKNIALGAAFLAARNGNMITMSHVIQAARREYRKIGRLCNEPVFSKYPAPAYETEPDEGTRIGGGLKSEVVRS